MKKRRKSASYLSGTKIRNKPPADLDLQESEARYQAIFEQSANAIVVFNPKTLAILDFNNEACRRLGYTRDEFAKLKISDFEAVESASGVKRHAQNIPTTGIEVFETKHRTKSGAVLDIEVRAKTINLDGKTLVQGVWRDVTARKEMEERLRKSQALLKQTERISRVGG